MPLFTHINFTSNDGLAYFMIALYFLTAYMKLHNAVFNNDVADRYQIDLMCDFTMSV